jgi:hypothetical protein
MDGFLSVSAAIRMILYLVSVNLLVKLALQPTRLRFVLFAVALHLFALVFFMAVEVNHRQLEWLARDVFLFATAAGMMFAGIEALASYAQRRDPWERDRG